MRIISTLSCLALFLALAATTFAQTASSDTKHFEKDGLSFDYPANWQLSDQSTPQMQFLQLLRDGYAEIRIRSPREPANSPQKEAEAKRLMQEQYVDSFAKNIEGAGLHPNRSSVTTQIAGGDAEGARVRATLDGEPGGMDSYYRIVSGRLIQLSIIGSQREITRSAAAWDSIRNSVKVEPPPQPQPKPKPPAMPTPVATPGRPRP